MVAPSALLSIQDGNGAIENQGQGYIQELTPGDVATFALQTPSSVVPGLRWVLVFESADSRQLDDVVFIYAPPVGPSIFQILLPPGGFLSRYVTTIYDSNQNPLSQYTGEIEGVGPAGATGPTGPAGPQGPAGSGTAIGATGATLTTNTTLSNGAFVRYTADAGQATQFTLTMGGSPTAGDSYLIKCVGNPATGNPVLLSGGGKNLEDPSQPGVYGAGPFPIDVQGDSLWYQYNGHTTQWDRLA